MDKKYVEENEIEIKYLRNQLTPEELEEFEVYLMENPEMLESVKLDSVIELALNERSTKGLDVVKSKNDMFMSWLKLPALKGPAFFLVGAFIMGMFLNNIEPNSQVTRIAYLSESRGFEKQSNAGVKFEFPMKSFNFWSRDQLLLVIDSGLKANTEYAMQISKEDKFGNLKVYSNMINRSDQLGNLIIPILARKYPVGDYLIGLQKVGDNNAKHSSINYRFSMVELDKFEANQ